MSTVAALTTEVPPPPRIATYSGLVPSLRNAGLLSETWQDAVALAIGSEQFEAVYKPGDSDGMTDASGGERPDVSGRRVTVEEAYELTGTLEAFLDSVTIVQGERFVNSFGEQERWAGGQQHRPIGCSPSRIWSPCEGTEKTYGTQPDIVSQSPFQVYADDQCSTWGYPFAERAQRAVTNLVRHQSNTIADELWTGAQNTLEGGSNLSLSQSAVALTSPGDSSPYTFALGALQESLAECLGDGNAGIIWATRNLVQAWFTAGAIWYERAETSNDYWQGDGYLVDVFGNLIISSGGFDGSDPDGLVTSGVPWAYATGPLVLRLGGIDVIPDSYAGMGPTLQTINEATVVAERAFTYELDGCCIFGIAADLCNACCGTGS